MSSSSPGTNASSGSGTKSLTEAGAPCAPAVPFRLPRVLGTAPHAGTHRRANGLQSSCSRFAVFAPAPIDPFPIRSIASCCLPLAALLLLVCTACPVSVSVRLACSAERDLRGTRDTTPGLCSASFCCSPRLHPLLASMAVPVGTRPIELSQYPRLGGVRGLRARSNDARWGTRRGTNRIARLYGVMRQGAHHWVAALAKSAGNPRRCVPVRSVTTRSRLVTLLLPQTNRRRNADEGWRRDRAGWCVSVRDAAARDANYCVMRSTGRPEGLMLTSISKPCGHRLSGDEAGFGALASEDAMTGINRIKTVTAHSN